MKTQYEKILHDIQKMDYLSREFNLSNQKEIDALYGQLKKQKHYGFYSWVGDAFYHALGKKSKGTRRRRCAVFCLRQIELLIFLTAFFLLGIGVAHKMQEYESRVLQEALREIRAGEKVGKVIEDSAAMQEASAEETTAEKISVEDIMDEEVPMTGESALEVPKEASEPKILEEYRSFYDINPDFVGWLTIEGTAVDYPVLQNREDPGFYLSHNFFKDEQISGAIFLDRTANTYPMDDNIVIYGHNTGDGTIFGSLKNYKNESFYREHAEFEFDTCYEKAVYQIVAVVITDISESGDFCYYDFSNYDRDGFLKCMNFIKENQLYETGRGIDYGDSLVMLSTCEKSSKSSRLIVIGKKIPKVSDICNDIADYD